MHGELLTLGVKVGASTVWEILRAAEIAALEQGEVAAAVVGVPDQDLAVDDQSGGKGRGEQIDQVYYWQVPGQVSAWLAGG